MVTPAERAARIDQRIADIRAGDGLDPNVLRWLADIEHETRGLLDDALAAAALEEQLRDVKAELTAVDLERQIIADAATALIDTRRSA